MSEQSKHSYEFGPFHLDPAKHLLLRDGQAIPLTPKAFDTLLMLVENSQRVVEKDDLMHVIWPDSFVEEGSLTRNIYLLRKTLGENPNDHRYIVTVPGRGYRLSPA
jgi:eukaryotic-like serine/threonine-protein kinase